MKIRGLVWAVLAVVAFTGVVVFVLLPRSMSTIEVDMNSGWTRHTIDRGWVGAVTGEPFATALARGSQLRGSAEWVVVAEYPGSLPLSAPGGVPHFPSLYTPINMIEDIEELNDFAPGAKERMIDQWLCLMRHHEDALAFIPVHLYEGVADEEVGTGCITVERVDQHFDQLRDELEEWSGDRVPTCW